MGYILERYNHLPANHNRPECFKHIEFTKATHVVIKEGRANPYTIGTKIQMIDTKGTNHLFVDNRGFWGILNDDQFKNIK